MYRLLRIGLTAIYRGSPEYKMLGVWGLDFGLFLRSNPFLSPSHGIEEYSPKMPSKTFSLLMVSLLTASTDDAYTTIWLLSRSSQTKIAGPTPFDDAEDGYLG